MIDFRYHLVSLFSVLIALAIGIFLGAGPLKEGIGAELGNQVTQLREEKVALRSELDAAQQSQATSRAFETEQLATIVAGKLSGRAVVLVRLPGADSGLVTRVEDTLADAGANLTGTVTIEESYADPTGRAATSRSALAAEVAPGLVEGVADNLLPGGQPLDRIVGAALLTSTPPTDAAPTEPVTAGVRRAAWAALREAGLVEGSLPTNPAVAAVVIGGPPGGTAAAAEAVVGSYAALAGELDVAGDAAVLASERPNGTTTAATEPSVVAAVRAESALRQRLSTVDDVDGPIGLAGVVLALAEQFTGESGQYGTQSGAGAAFPSAS